MMDYEVINRLDIIIQLLRDIHVSLSYAGAGGLFAVGVCSALFVIYFLYRFINIFLKMY